MKKISVEIEEGREEEFMSLVADFLGGNKPRVSRGIGAEGSYQEQVSAVRSDPSTSFVLRKRIAEDASRDPVDALCDAEMLHHLSSRRFAEAAPDARYGNGSAELLEAGIDALKRLYQVAQGDSGQCRYIARFLLGLYNGSRFPFDLTDLRPIDDALFDDCMKVLRMDARVRQQEVHTYFRNGGQAWERMGWERRIVDAQSVRLRALALVEVCEAKGVFAEEAKAVVEALKGERDEP